MKTLLVLTALACFAPAATWACQGCDLETAQHDHARSPSTGVQAGGAAARTAAGESRVTIPVSGMHCAYCVARVKAALSRMEGVKAVDADLDKGQAVVAFEKGKVDASRMVEAIDALGFKAGTPAQN